MKTLLHVHTDDGEHLSIYGEFYHITRVCFSHLRRHHRCLPTEKKACLPPHWQMLRHRLCRISSSETFPRSNLTTSEITSDECSIVRRFGNPKIQYCGYQCAHKYYGLLGLVARSSISLVLGFSVRHSVKCGPAGVQACGCYNG